MEIGLILFLIVINGIFAMSEIAIVSSRKSRLQRMADSQRPGATAALALHDDPSRFLSTIQVGITSVGILSGAMGETAFADPLATWLSQFAVLAPYAKPIALGVTVLLITYLSVVIGELVPKRLALLSPEGIASIIARPMAYLSRIASPLVWLFSTSSSTLLRLLGAKRNDEPPVTDDEINELMEQGAEAGVFHESEQEIVSNVLRLDELRVGAIMTPRKQVYAIDLNLPAPEIELALADSPFARIVVYREEFEHIVGVLSRGELLKSALAGAKPDLMTVIKSPLYIPDTVTCTHLLESFRKARTEFAIIVDEFGEMQGVVTLNDVLTAIVGDLPSDELELDPEVVERDDGSWLVDGGASIDRVKSLLELESDLPGEEEHAFHTIGGFIMHQLERIPRVADHVDFHNWRLEVVDMDKTRVDKIWISRRKEESL